MKQALASAPGVTIHRERFPARVENMDTRPVVLEFEDGPRQIRLTAAQWQALCRAIDRRTGR
jgi:hypothetical protein